MERPAAWAGGRGGPGFQEGLGQDARQEGAGSFWKGSLDRLGQQPRASPRRAAALPVRAGESAALPGTCRGGGGRQEAAPLQALGWGLTDGRRGQRLAHLGPRRPRATPPPEPHLSPEGTWWGAHGQGWGQAAGTLGQRTPCRVGRGSGTRKAGSHIRDPALCLSRTLPWPASSRRAWEGDRRRPRPTGRHAHLKGRPLARGHLLCRSCD